MTIKQSTINTIAVLAFLLIVFLLGGSVYFAGQAIQEEQQAVARQSEFKQLGIDLADASDYLTDEARQFAVTGHIEHLQNYWHEIDVTKTRDQVLARLKELKAPQKEFEQINLAKHNSDALVATETRSMRLVLEAQQIPKSSMHPAVAAWQLSTEDSQLTAEEKRAIAIKIMFDAQYQVDKRIIMEPIAQFQKLMNARAAREVEQARNKTHTATTVLVLMVFFILIGMGLVLWVFQTQLSRPIAQYITELRRRDMTALEDFTLIPAGTEELHLLADVFNQQFHLNQQQLREKQNLIEDIVQVSQGLADGNLHVMPTAQYRGDFVQIKNALETTLTSLRQVIEDIVRVSQGIAEGQLHIQPKTEYRGEFVQIKNALETAATQLAKTTTKNTEQNWLKTGQTQLNDRLSGEKNLLQLAKNTIDFITPYIDAQIGAFYLFEDTPKSGLKMIASHAYMWRKNVSNEFQLGEGLIGQAALEQKMIIITEPPADYLYIQSGLGKGTPRAIVVIPFLYEETLKGVIEIASFNRFTDVKLEFLNQVMPNIAIVINSAQSRDKMQELLQQTQIQSEELQRQTEELQSQQNTLQQTNEKLQRQSQELQVQQEELRQANEELEERTQELERQKNEIRANNLALEQSQQAIEIKAKELELASQYKSEFLANMSHELRTPLNSLLILARLLSENRLGNLTEQQVEYAKTVYSAGTDLLTLINDILDLSKVEAGQLKIHLEQMQLVNLVEILEQKFRCVADEKKLDFLITKADDLPSVLYTDVQRLQQILNNLLSNAFKFTETGEVQLKIMPAFSKTSELETQSKIGEQIDEDISFIAFQVTDTGIGIPKDKQQLIFEAFQQVDGSTSRRYGGTGLGLSISRQLAKLLGGQLQLESIEGKGSTFTLYLPKQTDHDEKKDSEPNPMIQSAPKDDTILSNQQTQTEPAATLDDDRNLIHADDKTILIIEDDRKFLKIVVELARERHFKCLIAEEGETGLQLAEQYRPNAIILDVGLPKLDGLSVMERLKDNPDSRAIPVYFISAFEQEKDAKKMGAIGYLTKPVKIPELTEVFKKIEQLIAKTLKNILVVIDNETHYQAISEIVESQDIETTLAHTVIQAMYHLQKTPPTPFDCLIVDVDVENRSGIQLLEQLGEQHKPFDISIILYAQGKLTDSENDRLSAAEKHLTIKAVYSPERLLDELTLFLHQVEANLPLKKSQMLKRVHDKEAIFKHKKILVVDDDMRNAFALTTVLEDKQMEVVVAQNGADALTRLEKHPNIALVLMDIMMPQMDGYEAIQQIRNQPRFHQLPIIALTAKAMKSDKAKCLEAGANDYLSKPVDTDKLFSMMRVWLYR
jgi:signal transduction histidine kinase/DNA-binding response OmpR family regulator/methyl-accepting chemotaxis protein